MSNKLKCKFCGKEVERINRHLDFCKNIPSGISKDEAFIEEIKHNFGDNIIREVINDYTNDLSLPDIYKKYGLSYHYTQKILVINGITLRGISESATKITANKHRKTCMEKYGVENVSQVDVFKEKKKKTFTKNYGVDNIWKSEEYKQFTRDRWNSYTDEEKTKLLNICKKRQGTISQLEKKIVSCLIDLGIEIETQFKFKKYFHKYDIKIKNANLLIEVNGDFWHANPDKYGPEDILNFSNTNHIKANDIWKKDEKNKKFAEKNNYKILYIWESDIINKKDIEIKKYLLNLINENKNG
jgi:G:T-mismatch repair DNA endonuclease (very short patch repair protein)